jgi:hypothetical protein
MACVFAVVKGNALNVFVEMNALDFIPEFVKGTEYIFNDGIFNVVGKYE